MSDLDTLARAATRELLDRSTPDVSSRYAELKRIRTRRTTAKLVAAAAAVATRRRWLAADRSRRGTSPGAGDPQPGGAQRCLLGVHDFGELGLRPVGHCVRRPERASAHRCREPSRCCSSPPTVTRSTTATTSGSWPPGTWPHGTKTVLAPCPELGCLMGSVSPDGSTGMFAGDGHVVLVDLATGATRSQTAAGGRRRARVVTGRTAARASWAPTVCGRWGSTAPTRCCSTSPARPAPSRPTAWPGRPTAAGSRSSTSRRSLRATRPSSTRS